MVPHRRILLLLALVLTLPLALVPACDKVPLLAPTGTVITLLPATNTVSLNSQIEIVATAIQNGVASAGAGSGATTTSTTSTGGQPVQNGTVISFTTTIGTIQPQEARTHDGQVTVTLSTGNQSGTATITAYSGGASSSVKLAVGTAGASNIIVSATPASLPSSGGSTQITAQVTDDGGSGIGGVPVVFTISSSSGSSSGSGTLTPSTATTDANGNATVTLNTTSTTTVQAAVGAKTATVTVNVSARSLTAFMAAPQSTTAGTPVIFSVTPGTTIPNVHINFGDGASTDTGAIGGGTTPVAVTFPHVYNAAGTYTATATASDGSSLSTQVAVGALSMTLAASPNPAVANTPVTFTATVPSGTEVSGYAWTWKSSSGPLDSGNATTSSPQLTLTFTTPGVKIVTVNAIGLNGATIGTAQIQINVTP